MKEQSQEKVREENRAKKIALYPGSFDPFTNGHLDIVDRACEIFDELVLAIAHNSKKTTLFTLEERKKILEEVMADRPCVRVAEFEGLTTTYARTIGATAIVRGIRAVTDFDYEYAIFQVNRDLEPEIDTVFLLASRDYSFLSSTIIKEVARYGKTFPEYAPEAVNRALLRKFGYGDP
jgi:pantetheine-phosphate adenylyltransferase